MAIKFKKWKNILKEIIDAEEKTITDAANDLMVFGKAEIPSTFLQVETLKTNYEYVSEELKEAQKRIKELEKKLEEYE